MDAFYKTPFPTPTHSDAESVLASPDQNSGSKGRSLPRRPRAYLFSERRAEADQPSLLSGAIETEPSDDAGVSAAPRLQKRKPRTASFTSARDGVGELLEVVHPRRQVDELILASDSARTLISVADEFRRGDEIRRHGLPVRSKLLFCGPPGCGKTLCAEVLAAELRLPLVVARLDAIIASHLGETASNLRKIFDATKTRPAVLFLDEFDALARTRSDATEHNEIRRVVNSLLMMIDRYEGRGLLVAATNLEGTLDRAVWRRFDEVVVFEAPTVSQIRRMLQMKVKNYPADFDIARHAEKLAGMSFAEVERICISAIKNSILAHSKRVSEDDFLKAVRHELRRSAIEKKLAEHM